MKRILLGVLGLIVVVAIAFGAMLFSAFHGLQPLVDGAPLPGGAVTVKDGMVAVYVIPVGDGTYALVDCGNDPQGVALLAELGKLHATPDAVRAIFLTHGHPDHTAACHLFPKAEVYAFAADVALASGQAAGHGMISQFLHVPPEKRVTVTKPLTQDQLVQVGPLAVQAYAVPGHTGGSAAYLAGGTLYVGDAFSIDSAGALRLAPSAFSDSSTQNSASIKALAPRVHDAQAIAPAHSGSAAGMAPLQAFAAQ